jgi:hypothetical protein
MKSKLNEDGVYDETSTKDICGCHQCNLCGVLGFAPKPPPSLMTIIQSKGKISRSKTPDLFINFFDVDEEPYHD